MNIQLKSYNAVKAKKNGKSYTWLDRLIMLRSKPHTHSEVVFSERYGGISFSATSKDGCWCCRFKQIGYSHPKRWDTVIIPCTDEEEDRAWKEACRMAGLPIDWQDAEGWYWNEGNCYYDSDSAIKYDILGQVCHFTKWKIWMPTKGKIWCSRACNEIIIAGKKEKNVPLLLPRRAEIMPDELDEICTRYWG